MTYVLEWFPTLTFLPSVGIKSSYTKSKCNSLVSSLHSLKLSNGWQNFKSMYRKQTCYKCFTKIILVNDSHFVFTQTGTPCWHWQNVITTKSKVRWKLLIPCLQDYGHIYIYIYIWIWWFEIKINVQHMLHVDQHTFGV